MKNIILEIDMKRPISHFIYFMYINVLSLMLSVFESLKRLKDFFGGINKIFSLEIIHMNSILKVSSLMQINKPLIKTHTKAK